MIALIEGTKEMKNLITGRIDEEVGSFICTINSNNSQGKPLGEIQPKITPSNN